MSNNAEMLTVQDCQLIMEKFLNSKDFKISSHEAIYNDVITETCSLNIKVAIKEVPREVSFLTIPFQSHHLFQQANVPYGLSDTNPDLAPIYITRDNIVVVLVDQSQQQFAVAENNFAFSVEQVRLVLKTLAKSHAECIRFEEAKLIEDRPDLQKGNELLENWFSTRLEALSSAIDLLPQSNLQPQRFKEGLRKITAKVRNVINDATKSFRGVVCHGYVAGDSVLFKTSNGAPVACKLMKFEPGCYAPPAFDVLQFIYMVTSPATRQHHLHEFLQLYYDSLREELKERALQTVLPTEEEFEISVHLLLPLVKFQTTCLKQTSTLKKAKFDATTIANAFKIDKNYRKIMTDALLDLQDVILHPALTKEDCFLIVKNKIGTTNYELLSFELLPISNVNGFFGDHKKLKIEVRVNNEPQTLNMFVKFIPKGKAQKSIADDCGSFFKENFFYRRFVPMIQGFNVSVINDCTVPCYFTRQDDVMVFEDFAIKKYGILNHRQPLTFEKASLIVKQLAKFHACSIILEEKLGEETKTKFCLKEHYDKELQESFFNNLPKHQGSQSVKISFDAIDHQITLFPELEIPIPMEDLKTRINKACQMVYDLIKTSNKFRNAVCHGDLWVSNILVQRDGEELLDCRFVDFQIMRYCPPAHDLIGFLYLTTTRSFRKQYMDKVIKLYHNELSAVLNNHGYDVENIYPYDHFLKSIEYMLPQTVCQTVMYYHICIGDPELMKSHMASEEGIKQIFLEDRRDFIEEMCKKDPIYRERSKESIEDLLDLCVKYF